MIHLSTNFSVNCCIHHSPRCSSLSSQAWRLPRLFIVQMTTSAKLSTGLVHILATILNRRHWQGWFKTGAQSKSLVFTHSVHMLLMSCHPDAQCLQRISTAVDTHPIPRSTELISAEFELGQLWDEYGLVRDIVVSVHTIIWHFKLMYCLAIYKQLPMSWYSWTSITWLTTSTYQRLLQASFSNVNC